MARRRGAAAKEKIQDGLPVLKPLNRVVQSGAAEVLLDQADVAEIIIGDQNNDFFRHAHLFMPQARGQRNKKNAALAGFGFHPDPALLPFQNLLRDGQPQSFPFGGGRVQAMEYLEHLGLMFRRDADAVVLDRIDAAAILDFAGHFDPPRLIGPAILDRVVNQIGKDLVDLDGVAPAVGQGSMRSAVPACLI